MTFQFFRWLALNKPLIQANVCLMNFKNLFDLKMVTALEPSRNSALKKEKFTRIQIQSKNNFSFGIVSTLKALFLKKERGKIAAK